MLFDRSPRISRTETAPAAIWPSGRGMPDICFGIRHLHLRANGSAPPGEDTPGQSERQAEDSSVAESCRSRPCRPVVSIAVCTSEPALRTPCRSARRDRSQSNTSRRSDARARRLRPPRRRAASRDRARSGIGSSPPASSCFIKRVARARSRTDISWKSSSEIFPIARSNSSSLIVRSASAFSCSSARARALTDHRAAIVVRRRPAAAPRAAPPARPARSSPSSRTAE